MSRARWFRAVREVFSWEVLAALAIVALTTWAILHFTSVGAGR